MTESSDQPGKTSTRANGRATRARILAEATRFFADTGYEATSVRQIALAAEIDAATLLYHFGDKPGLFAEVYRAGHLEFLAVLDPLLKRLRKVEDRARLRDILDDFVVDMHDFVATHVSFIRLSLYRILEDPSDIIPIEDSLQSVAITTIASIFDDLHARGITRKVDTRAFVAFIIASFSAWHMTGRAKPTWLGEPGLASRDGRARSEAFYVDLVETYLLGDLARDSVR